MMNLPRLFTVAFLVLAISTYQTDSGIIFTLLMKILLLKGALFMTMPLSIGAFMMGQGMGFFAGNMMGGYMMLRAANTYHNKEKTKWMTYAEQGPYNQGGKGFGHGHNLGWKYHDAYDKGKDIGAALAALKSQKLQLASVLTKVKGVIGSKFKHFKKPEPVHHGWGWNRPQPVYKGHKYSGGGGYGGGYSGHGGGYSAGGGGYSAGGYSSGSPHGGYAAPSYASHTSEQSLQYKVYPHEDYASVQHQGAHSQGEDFSQGQHGELGDLDLYKSQLANLEQSTYQQSEGSSYAGVGMSVPEQVQDPGNTYYTSAYEGPGHEYTGILTHGAERSSSQNRYAVAQDKSNEDQQGSAATSQVRTAGKLPPATATASPNPMLEKYLEKRLEEEADKQKDFEQKQEAQQLIQLLRRAYLKQLVDSLKEEETVARSSETVRDSRSIETESNKKFNILEQFLFRKIPSSTEVMGFLTKDPPTTMESLKLTSSEASVVKHIFSSSTSTEADLLNSYLSSTERTIAKEILGQLEKEAGVDTADKMSSQDRLASILSTERITEDKPKVEPSIGTAYQHVNEDDKEDTTTSTTTTEGPRSSMEMPAMWVKDGDSTFSNDAPQVFSIRVRRQAEDDYEEVEVSDEVVVPTNKGQSLQQAQQQVNAQGQGSQGQGGPSSQAVSDAEKQLQSFVDDIKKFFTLLTVLDQDMCLQKLVCDVHTNQKDVSTLTQYETNILTTFKLMKAVMPAGEEDSSTKYRRAALIGETGQSLELCHQTYTTCGFSSSQIITLGTQAEATPEDWTDHTPSATGRRADYVTLMPRVRRTLRSFYL